jgi:hypothetical protein
VTTKIWYEATNGKIKVVYIVPDPEGVITVPKVPDMKRPIAIRYPAAEQEAPPLPKRKD